MRPVVLIPEVEYRGGAVPGTLQLSRRTIWNGCAVDSECAPVKNNPDNRHSAPHGEVSPCRGPMMRCLVQRAPLSDHE